MWGAWKSHGLLLLAAGVLVASGAYAPWLVGAMGERGWFRWCIEWIPYTLFATVGLDFDGVRVAAAWSVVGGSLGGSVLLLLQKASALPAATAKVRRQHGANEEALLLQLEVWAEAAGGAGTDAALATRRLPGHESRLADPLHVARELEASGRRVGHGADAHFLRLLTVATQRECLRWAEETAARDAADDPA